MSKMILTEWFEISADETLLREQDREDIKSGKTIMVGVMQKCNAENGNGRVYPPGVLQREIKNYDKLVRERRALGELDHPDSSVVNLQNVSHIVTDIWWDGKKVMGKIEILPTPSGNILKSLVESGVKMGISSRALGSVRQHQGRTIVEPDLQLICFDMVSEPSTPDAFMLKEHREPATKEDKINNLLDSIIGK